MLRKKLIARCFLLPALLCAILAAGVLSTSGSAHAAPLPAQTASLQPHAVQPAAYVPGENCPYGNAEMDFVYYGSIQILCLPAKGNHVYYIPNVFILNTGLHQVDWDWYDCNSDTNHYLHKSSRPPLSIVTAANTPTGFGGPACGDYMALVVEVYVAS